MRSLLFITSLVMTTTCIQAQSLSFTAADPQPDILEIYAPSSAAGDIDGDGDIDLFQSGIAPRRESGLFRNDGNGNFEEVTATLFPRASSSAAIFEDLDNDGDLDLFFSGDGAGIGEFSHVYLNDGQGVFTLLDNPDLPAFTDSGAAVADVDQDGDPDLLLIGQGAVGTLISDIFLNDGDGIFTPAGSEAFTPIQFGRAVFFDLEGDEDPDLIISGERQDGMGSTTIYLNDGDGNYSPTNSSALLQIGAADVDTADIDQDGDIDLLISGANVEFMARTILYLNDGSGQFSELTTANLQQTFAGSNAIEDMDNDGDLDILITGSQEGGLPNIYNILYENLGDNSFAPVDTLGGEYISGCIVADFNGDELVDIIIQGFAERTTVYWNTSTLTSVERLNELPGLAMFPNPTSGLVTVSNTEGIPALQLRIFASDGRLVYEQANLPGVNTVLEHNLPTGTYVAQFRSGTFTTAKKLVVID